jgi:hypothetical protein
MYVCTCVSMYVSMHACLYVVHFTMLSVAHVCYITNDGITYNSLIGTKIPRRVLSYVNFSYRIIRLFYLQQPCVFL